MPEWFAYTIMILAVVLTVASVVGHLAQALGWL